MFFAATKLAQSIHAFVVVGNKIDKLPGFFSSRTIRSYLEALGRIKPDISFVQMECVRGRRLHLKFDEMSLAFVGKIYAPHAGIVGCTSPYTSDDVDGHAKQVLQFYATDADTGVSFIGPYFFVSTLTSMDLELTVTRVVMAYNCVSTVINIYLFI